MISKVGIRLGELLKMLIEWFWASSDGLVNALAPAARRRADKIAKLSALASCLGVGFFDKVCVYFSSILRRSNIVRAIPFYVSEG